MYSVVVDMHIKYLIYILSTLFAYSDWLITKKANLQSTSSHPPKAAHAVYSVNIASAQKSLCIWVRPQCCWAFVTSAAQVRLFVPSWHTCSIFHGSANKTRVCMGTR